MTVPGALRQTWLDFIAAIQFLTRIPVSSPYAPDSLGRAVKFFPLVGLLIGGCAALLNLVLVPHLPRLVAALLIVIFLVLITGCFHEDGLADAADAFGGGWTREQTLAILKDSRIGSYGGAALTLSLLARVVLLASLPSAQVARTLIVAHVLCRWTTLPLAALLPPARTSENPATTGQGARIARLTSTPTLVFGTLLSFVIAGIALGSHAILPILGAILVALLTGAYYKRRLAGVTGDCFGATNQLTEVLVYLCGAWIA